MRLQLRGAPFVGALVVMIFSLSGCGTEQFKPAGKPVQFTLRGVTPVDSKCKHFELHKHFSGGGNQENRGSKWWITKVWRNEQRCEVSSTALLYRTNEEAEENYTRFSPQDVYGSSWPWEPIEVDPPNWIAARQARVICLGGDLQNGCMDWYYWARYGNSLVELEFFNVDTLIDSGGIRITKKQFLALVRKLDTRVAEARSGTK